MITVKLFTDDRVFPSDWPVLSETSVSNNETWYALFEDGYPYPCWVQDDEIELAAFYFGVIKA